MAVQRFRRRVASVAAALAGTTGCPGPGVVNRLAVEEDADPPPSPDCGGCHVLVVEEVVVGGAEEPVGDAG